MSNRILTILLNYTKSRKQDVSLGMSNEDIAKAVSYNLALEETVIFLDNLLNNRIAPEVMKTLEERKD